MDMKKKLEEAYLPEKDARKKKVVVGLSGGISSFVTAYLLKIQKYDLIGVTVSTSWENYEGDQGSTLSCFMNQAKIESIQAFCHSIGIPHMVLKASDEFKDIVVENWLTSRIAGKNPVPCWSCHELRMRLLYEKMKQLGAEAVATGHFAKLFHQEAHHSVYVHSSNDEVHDQSNLLSRLPHDILASLMLPLSDLQKSEVLKLAENFGLESVPKKVEIHHCFEPSPDTNAFLEKNIPLKLRLGGELMSVDNVDSYGDHEGIDHYQYGQVIEISPQYRPSATVYVSKYTVLDKKLLVGEESYFSRQEVFLTQCNITEETPWHEPLKGVMKTAQEEVVDCWVYPKNLNAAVVRWETPHKVLEGEIVSIYKKRGKNSKVFLSGKVRYIPDEPVDEEGVPLAKVDYSRNF